MADKRQEIKLSLSLPLTSEDTTLFFIKNIGSPVMKTIVSIKQKNLVTLKYIEWIFSRFLPGW